MNKLYNKLLSTNKSTGRTYTPKYIVQNILDLSGYYGKNIIKKHVIDNSCGDGAFLTEIVSRYCSVQLENLIDNQLLVKELETYIHGIEIDEQECKKCIQNLDQAVVAYGISNVNWDITCADALNTTRFIGKMDFVLGNPPYIRVHNLGNTFREAKKFSFAQNGMTDIFIVFYEIGIRMLTDSGILGYITPSSFYNSLACSYMRHYFVKNNLIDKIVNLQHY